MNSNPGESVKLLVFIFVSNLIGIGIVVSLSLNHDVSFREFGFAAIAAFAISLFSLILFWSHSLTRRGNSHRQPLKSTHRLDREPKLSNYLANATILATGIAGWLVLVNGLLAFDVEIGQSIRKDLESVFDWMIPIATLFAGTAIACNFLAFLFWLIIQDRWRQVPIDQMRREDQARYRRKLARERAEANRIAQLNKPDFAVRLNQFVANVESGSEHASEPDNEPFVSRAKFWQCEPFHERTLPKPIEFIRRILQRIAKTVHGA